MSEIQPKREWSGEASQESWATFRHPTLRFSLRYPSDWKPKVSEDAESCFAAASPNEKICFEIFAYPWENSYAYRGHHLLRHVWGYSDDETRREMRRWNEARERLLRENPDDFVQLTEFSRGEDDSGARLIYGHGSITTDKLIFKSSQLYMYLAFEVASSEYEAAASIFEKIADSMMTFPEGWYCGRRPAKVVAADEVTLYRLKGISSRDNKRIKIPRCLLCKALHERGSRILNIGMVIGIVFGVILVIVFGLIMWLPALLAVAIVSWIAWLIAFITARGTKSLSEAKNYPDVSEKIRQGWKMYADEHHYG